MTPNRVSFALRAALLCALGVLVTATPAYAESQNEYQGISDPFGDPSAYEFSEDEREDKEFFHLGRFLMFGFDVGIGSFTGGLGTTADPGINIGANLRYFFDKSLALELGVHYSSHLDQLRTTGGFADLDVSMLELMLGFRFYFDVKNAPRAIAVANPYLAFGGGMYSRDQTPRESSSGFPSTTASDSPFGAQVGAGVEFAIYKRHIYLGLDVRYHLIFFPDEGPLPGAPSIDRSGDYFTARGNLSYNF